MLNYNILRTKTATEDVCVYVFFVFAWKNTEQMLLNYLTKASLFFSNVLI